MGREYPQEFHTATVWRALTDYFRTFSSGHADHVRMLLHGVEELSMADDLRYGGDAWCRVWKGLTRRPHGPQNRSEEWVQGMHTKPVALMFDMGHEDSQIRDRAAPGQHGRRRHFWNTFSCSFC